MHGGRRRRGKRAQARRRILENAQASAEFTQRIENLAAQNFAFYQILEKIAEPAQLQRLMETRKQYLESLKKSRVFKALLESGTKGLTIAEGDRPNSYKICMACIMEKNSGFKLFVAFDKQGKKTMILKSTHGGEEHFSEVTKIGRDWRFNPGLISRTPEEGSHAAKIIAEIRKTEKEFRTIETPTIGEFVIVYKLL